ncbi:hypothetical protein F183_A54520 (plasmid) [Bryobacterales bacterium F-183]|nr:hypothetical protein F183_A54520 [Bryobacterales bacterium F-183]
MIEYRNAVQQDPKSAIARHRLGRTYVAYGSLKSAVTEFSEALQLNSSYQEARVDLAAAHIARNELDLAEPLIRATIAAEPNNAAAHALQGQWLAATGNMPGAFQAVEKAIQLAPNRPDLYLVLGGLHMRNKRPADAEAVFRRSVKANPQSAEAHLMLAQFFFTQRRPGDAEKQTREGIAASPKDVPIRLFLAQILAVTNRLPDAEKTLREVKALDPENPQAYRSLAVFLESTGQFDRAVAEYREVLKAKPLDTDVRYRLVECLLASNKLDDAEKENRDLLKTNAKSAQPHFNLGRIQMARRQYAEAILSLQTAASLEGRADVYYLLGNAQVATGLTKQARDSFAQALEVNPKMIEATLAIAGLAIASGDRSGAIRLADSAVAAAPDSVQALVTRARVLLATGDLKQGETILLNALQKDPYYIPGLSLLLDLRISQKRADEMPQRFAQLIQQQPKRPDLRWLSAVSYYAIREFGKAEAEVRQALQIDPQIQSAHRLLADVLISRGEFEQAKNELRAAIAAEPANVGNYLALVQLYERDQNWEEMKKLYTTARQVDPASPLIANQLAYLLLEHGGDINLALSLAQLAKEKMPTSPHVADTLGLAYLRRGMNDLALAQFKVAAQIDEPVHQYHLGLGYAANKNNAAAADAFQRALSSPAFQNAPEAKLAREALAKLPRN